MNLFELTRRGLNLCDTCGKPKIMYFVPWCPRCAPPTLQTIYSLNLLQALEHMEAGGHAGIYMRLWRYLCDMPGFSNDSYMYLALPTDENEDYDPQVRADLQTLRSVFQLHDDHVLLELRW